MHWTGRCTLLCILSRDASQVIMLGNFPMATQSEIGSSMAPFGYSAVGLGASPYTTGYMSEQLSAVTSTASTAKRRSMMEFSIDNSQGINTFIRNPSIRLINLARRKARGWASCTCSAVSAAHNRVDVNRADLGRGSNRASSAIAESNQIVGSQNCVVAIGKTSRAVCPASRLPGNRDWTENGTLVRDQTFSIAGKSAKQRDQAQK